MKSLHPSEFAICKAFNQLLQYEVNGGRVAPGFRWHHTPTGARSGNRKQRIISAGRDKAMGAKKGVPDYFFMWSRATRGDQFDMTFGFLEAKSNYGSLNPEQKEYFADCRVFGIPCEIFRDAEEGIKTLKRWGALL